MIAIKQPRPTFSVSLWLERFDVEPLEALPLLTVVLLLTAAPDQWYLRGPLVALCALGVVFRSWLKTPQFWYVVATLLGTTVYLNWESSDNHKYLFVYGSLALCGAFSLPGPQQGAALALSCRWLIGLCMLLATAWKLAMPDYRDGAFFEFTLLADERFAYFASAAAQEPLKTLADNRALVELLRDNHVRGVELQSVVLAGSPITTIIAQAMTWWTVAIEGLLAIVFLMPDNRRIAFARNALLLLFAATTYVIAPVRGFGWMLMLLGLGQCRERDRLFRPLFLAALLLIQLYTLPIAAILHRVLP